MLLKDGVRSHPKVLKAGAEAAWLWACCIDYSRSQLTDGVVPNEALPTLANCRSKVEALVQRLVEVGLLHRVEGGVQIHDYLEHNDSADKVRAERAAATARQAAHRARSQGSDGVVTPMSQRDSDVTAPSPRARVGVGVGNGVGTAPLNGGSHKAHALCGQVCLPAFLFSEFIRLKGGDESAARAYVEQWWMRLDDELQTQHPPIGDGVAYLRQRWAQTHPTTVSTVSDFERVKAEFVARGRV